MINKSSSALQYSAALHYTTHAVHASTTLRISFVTTAPHSGKSNISSDGKYLRNSTQLPQQQNSLFPMNFANSIFSLPIFQFCQFPIHCSQWILPIQLFFANLPILPMNFAQWIANFRQFKIYNKQKPYFLPEFHEVRNQGPTKDMKLALINYPAKLNR